MQSTYSFLFITKHHQILFSPNLKKRKMSTKLVQSPTQVVPTIAINITKMMRGDRAILATHNPTSKKKKKNSVVGQYSNGHRLISSIKAAEESSSLVGEDELGRKEEPPDCTSKTVAQVKAELFDALQGII